MKWNGLARMFTPATTAVSISPLSIAFTARSKATSEEEQAVSMVRLGPVKLKTWEMRLAMIDSALPVTKCASAAEMSEMKCSELSSEEAPTKTPTLLPASADSGTFASSNASRTNSSRRRCCGSICSASRGESPKAPASKPKMSSSTPAAKV